MDYQRLVLERCDPDRLVALIDGTEMRHRILPAGALNVRIEKLHLGSGVVQSGRYGMGVLADGALPSGMDTVGFILDAPADVTINGFLCPPLSVQLYGEGCELSYRASPWSAWLAYCLERERIQQAALDLYERPLPLPEQGSISIQPEAPAARRIATIIQALLAVGARAGSGKTINPLWVSLEDQLHYDIACALNGGTESGGTLKHVAQRRRLMARAEEYLRDHAGEPFRLSELTTATGVSQRMLEYHFSRLYGVNPHTWYLCMRLNGVHRDLQRARGTGERIGDIAMRWGFFHLGRFSEDYRRLFGERPRDTLMR
jgi:AraC-like DNA-binding protein